MGDDIKAATQISPLKVAAQGVTQYATKLFNEEKGRQFAVRLSAMAKDSPKLASCTAESIVTAMLACIQLDLMPNTPEAYAYVIPYFSQGGYKAQFQVGYKGMLELAYRTGTVLAIDAGLVFKEDTEAPYKWQYSIGADETFSLTPNLTIDRTKLENAIAVYALAKLSNGQTIYKVMTIDEINKVKETVKANTTGSPWKEWPEQMAKKTAIKQLLKYMPHSTTDKRLVLAAEYDSLAEVGKLKIAMDGQLVNPKEIQLPEQVHPEEPTRDVNADLLPEPANEAEIKTEASAIADKIKAEA